jgi:SAM-dependent methyltransferase
MPQQAEPPASTGYLPALRFKALTPLFDSVVRATTREAEFKDALLRSAGLRPGDSVLDLGSGTGTLAIDAKRLQPDCSVVGLDADPEIVGIARRKADEAGVEVGFEQGLATELPHPDGSLDHVLSTLFFHHLLPDDKALTLSEVARVLRPGGRLHVADFTRGADPLQRSLSWGVRLFDGRERTTESFTGRLPALIGAAGLREIVEENPLRTPLGTLSILHAAR